LLAFQIANDLYLHPKNQWKKHEKTVGNVGPKELAMFWATISYPLVVTPFN
jgi:hypothetical protein